MCSKAGETLQNSEADCQKFLLSKKTMLLSTVTSAGILETSVAPFVQLEDKFYVYVSDLAQHSQNLKRMAVENDKNPGFSLVSALIIADEAETSQLFARERMSLQLVPAEVKKSAAHYSQVMESFSAQFGELVELLQGLDFYLFELSCQSGGYVKGFGQAFVFENYPCQKLTQKTKI